MPSRRPLIALKVLLACPLRAAVAAGARGGEVSALPQSGAEQAPLGSPDFKPAPNRPVGWRGDGNGRYVAADPPLTWGRVSASSCR